MASANPLNLFAAQSLDRAAPELASLFQEETGTEVIVRLGHSGFLRTEIEGNLPCDIFCSADTGHPKALLTALKATKGFVYARNRLVVVSREERRFMRSTWLSLLTDPSITIGISRRMFHPKATGPRSSLKTLPRSTGVNLAPPSSASTRSLWSAGTIRQKICGGKPPQASCCGTEWTLPWSTQATLTG